MENRKQHAGRMIKVILFLTILFLFFLFFTYLFRNTDYNARQNVLDFYAEDTELDAVFIGASNVYRYWDPMGAWEKEGIATRNYAVSSMDAATYLSAVKDIMKHQDPKLIVVEARRFRNVGDTDTVTLGARNMLDSLDYDFSRLQAVHYYCRQMEIPWKEALSLYIDLIQYHDNYDALTSKLNWQLADNRSTNNKIERQTYKGYAISAEHIAYEDPSENLTEEISYETGNGLRLYTELLEYCQEKEIPLLIVSMPMVITEEESKTLNALAETAKEYGVPFLDMNGLYEEIGLDFSEDFYDPHHVNVLGADKVTAYLAGYLKEQYQLTDHRNDPLYASWDSLFEEYTLQAEKARTEVREKLEKE